MSSTNNDSEDDDPRVHSSGMSSSGQPRRYELSKSELRKNNKPIMEKKRRARINQCLNELKILILDALKKDPARHTKLEKADILEMTVRHLQSLHRSGSGAGRPLTSAAAVGPTVDAASTSAALTAAIVQKFQTGYQECAGEVNRFVGRLDGVDDDIKKRLMSHLDSCVAKLRYVPAAAPLQPPPHVANDNTFSLQQQFDHAAAAAAAALMPMTVGRPQRFMHTGCDSAALLLPSVPPPVGGRLRTSAFTAIRGPSPADVDRSPYVYCDEPAVSSTSSWGAEDAAAAKSPPLDFSVKKTACAGNKRPLGDVPVNVPTAACSRKTETASGDDGHATPGRVPTPSAQPASRDGPPAGSDPNMWRPW